MSESSLGTLGVNIAAYAGQFMAELTRAENGMTKFQRGISRTLTRAGLDTIGLGNAARAMSNELRYVWNNIEKIPGIDPTTLASVQEMKGEVEEFQQAIHRLVAGGMGLFAQFGKSLGLVAGAITQAFQSTTLKELFTNPTMIAANFAAALADVDVALQADFESATKAAHAQNELAAATARTTEAKKAAASLIEGFTRAREEFNRSEAAALDRMKSEGETIRREMLTPLEEWADQLVRLNGLLNAGAVSQETFNRAMKAADSNLAQQQAKDSARRIDALHGAVFGPVDEATKNFQEIVTAGQHFQIEMDHLWREMSASGSEAFVDLLASGENVFGSLVDVAARAVQRMVAELMVINPLLNAVSGLFGVKSALPSMWSFGGGKAVGGPVQSGTSYLVGEKGPEMFTPTASGMITPNHALRQGGGDVKNFYIDARGADRTGLARLEAMIRQINGSIEIRALGAVMDHRRRGASYS